MKDFNSEREILGLSRSARFHNVIRQEDHEGHSRDSVVVKITEESSDSLFDEALRMAFRGNGTRVSFVQPGERYRMLDGKGKLTTHIHGDSDGFSHNNTLWRE